MSQIPFLRFLKMKMIDSKTSEIRNCHLAISIGTIFNETLIKVNIPLKKANLKMFTAQSQPSCLGLNQLNTFDVLTTVNSTTVI